MLIITKYVPVELCITTKSSAAAYHRGNMMNELQIFSGFYCFILYIMI